MTSNESAGGQLLATAADSSSFGINPFLALVRQQQVNPMLPDPRSEPLNGLTTRNARRSSKQ